MSSRYLHTLGLAPFILVFAGCLATAENCSFLNMDPLDLHDREVFFQVKGSSAWTPLAGSTTELAGRDVTYAYVIRENIDPDRSGVLVLKSGRLHRPDEPRKPTRSVTLVRHADGTSNGACGVVSEFGEHPINAESYDAFHDLGKRVPEMKTLSGFHIRYAARLRHCRRTDDNGPDSVADGNLRSNRGQFSFNDDVVSRETYSQALNVIGVGSAYAGSENLEDQRVEIRQYAVSANFPTCVRFSLPPPGHSSFLKINDLEALKKSDSGRGYVRADQKGWVISR